MVRVFPLTMRKIAKKNFSERGPEQRHGDGKNLIELSLWNIF